MNEFWGVFLQNILMAFAPVLASLLAAVLVAQAKMLWARAKQYNPDVTDALEWAARMAVKAAEQAGAADLIADKKAYALDVAEKWLAAKGLTIDLDLLDAAIEAAVFEELNANKPTAAHAVTGFLPE